jgi:hypothetical protein
VRSTSDKRPKMLRPQPTGCRKVSAARRSITDVEQSPVFTSPTFYTGLCIELDSGENCLRLHEQTHQPVFDRTFIKQLTMTSRKIRSAPQDESYRNAMSQSIAPRIRPPLTSPSHFSWVNSAIAGCCRRTVRMILCSVWISTHGTQSWLSVSQVPVLGIEGVLNAERKPSKCNSHVRRGVGSHRDGPE